MLYSLPPNQGDFSDEDPANPNSGRGKFNPKDPHDLERANFGSDCSRLSRENQTAGQGVDARLHDQKLVRLIAGYITNQNSAGKDAELAGKLVFYNNPVGADLYRRDALGQATASQRTELIAHALFPDKPRIAELYLRSRSATQILSINQAIELYVNEIFGADKELKGHAAFQVRWAKTTLEDRSSTIEERSEAIRAVASLELRAGGSRISSDSSLARLLGISPHEVQAALQTNESGFTPQEVRQRGALLTIMEKGESQLLGKLVAGAISTLVRVENALHAEGVIKKLSSDEKIAALFGVDSALIEQYVRLAPPFVLDYRLKTLGKSVPEQRKEEMLGSVISELDQYRHGLDAERPSRLRTTIELSREFGLSPVAVFRHLKEGLPFLDWSFRDERLRRQSGEREIDRVKTPILEYVQQKIDDHRAKKTSRVQSWEELANVFQVQEETIIQVLNQLPPSEATYRLEHIHLPGFSSRFASQRSIMTGFVKEELKAYLNQEVSTISTDRDLAAIFPLSPIEIREHLRDPHLGLKLEELKVRNFVLSTSSERLVADKAFDSLIADTLRSKVQRELHLCARDGEIENGGKREGRNGVDTIKDRPRASINYQGNYYDSIEEATYAHFLKVYCSLEIKPKLTYQIRVGRNEFDFRIGDALIECHSILPFKLKSGLGDFKDSLEYQRFRDLREEFSASKELKKIYLEEVKHLLAAQYRESREAILRASPEHRKSELIVITSAQEFYHMVLKRFATDGQSVPSLRAFLNEFESVKSAVKEANPESGRRYRKEKRRKDTD